MLPIRGKIGKVVILRPGALGDVLAVRGVIRFVKDAFPGVEVCLIAPGERGAFFRREGWADRTLDWERGAFSWLFSNGEGSPPAALRAAFAGCDWLLAYVDGGEDGWARLQVRLEQVAPAAGLVFCPSRPPAGHEEPIGQWLLRPALAFCVRYKLLPDDYPADAGAFSGVRVRTENPPPLPSAGGRSAVIHPGSGSLAKNWPLERYAELAGRLVSAVDRRGMPVVDSLLATSGEADGDLGERLADAVPGMAHLRGLGLEQLAAVLAHATIYIGNDSGVSHLASAVEDPGGRSPEVFVLFGPSDASVWAPPGAVVVSAESGMESLPVDAVWRAVAERLAHDSCGCGRH